MTDILVVTPVHTRWNDLTIRCAYALTNPTGGKLDYLQLKDGYRQESDGGRTNLVLKQEQARHLALSGGYDYVLFVEEDILPPPNAVELLLACDSDVAYSLYCLRKPPYLWSAYVVMDSDRMIGRPLTINPALAKHHFNEGAIIDVDGIGFGCTLVSKSVLEKVNFRIDYNKPHQSGVPSYSDFYFSLDCEECGFTSRMHLGCRCGHLSPLNEDGVFDPCIIFPVIEESKSDNWWCRFLPLAEVKAAKAAAEASGH